MSHVNMTVSYGQIAVFDGRLDNPFNDWKDTHILQGFSWRPGSVSFSTLREAVNIEVAIEVSSTANVHPECQRAITVPFLVEPGANIEIATISNSQPFQLDPGNYQLIYETGRRLDASVWVRFTFVPNGTQDPKILVRDDELNPPAVFLMEADPA